MTDNLSFITINDTKQTDRWQLRRSGKFSVLPEDICWFGSKHDENVNDAALREPVRIHLGHLNVALDKFVQFREQVLKRRRQIEYITRFS